MLIKQTSRFITAGLVTLSIVTIGCALVSKQFRMIQERAYATRLEARRMADQLAEGRDRLSAEDQAVVQRVLQTHQEGGVQFHKLQTRRAGAHKFVSVHVLVPGAWSVQRAMCYPFNLYGSK
jgi:hypothetical protein